MTPLPIPPLILSSPPTLVQCEPAWKWDLGEMPDWDLWICMSGCGTLESESFRYDVEPGFAILIAPGTRSLRGRHQRENPLSVCFCHFHEPDRGLVEDLVGKACYTGMDPRLSRYVELLTDPAIRDLPHEQAHLLTALLCFFRESGRRPVRGSDAVLRGVMARMDRDPANMPPMTELARQCGMSSSRFRRRFREIAGCPPVQYLLHSRLRRARWYLRESPLSVAEIARQLGYEDPAYFCRQFKEATGRTPRQWRGR